MSHELDSTNGITSFAAREDAWHRLGTTVGHAMTAQEALDLAHLTGWNVRKVPLYFEETRLDDTGVTSERIEVPEKFATVRTNPISGATEPLGVVGGMYQPIQNEEHVDLFEALISESGAHFETAGALRGGREVFVTMKFPEHMQIGGIDPVSMNIAALNSHDGTGSFRFIVTPVRIVCANTQAAALSEAVAKFSARHTRNARGVIQQAREALDMTFRYQEAFQAEAERMIQETVTAGEFERMMRDLWPFQDGKESTQSKNRRALVMDLFQGSPTNTEIRGTRWAAYNAVTEYVDHFAPVRGQDKAEARAERAVSDFADGVKRRAFALAQV